MIDPTQFDPESHYFDPKSTRTIPRWQTVKVSYVETFANYISIDSLRDSFTPDELMILRKGSRLSVTPVEPAVAKRILKMARA